MAQSRRGRRVAAASQEPTRHERRSPLISIQRVSKRYPRRAGPATTCRSTSAAASCIAIVGENGAGKSTLMKILSGVITDYDGELSCCAAEPCRFAGTRDAEAAGVSIIHQELNLVEQLSAAANIFLGRELRSALGLLDERRMERDAAELFDRAGVPTSTRGSRSARCGSAISNLIEIAKALSLRCRHPDHGRADQRADRSRSRPAVIA